MYETTEGGVLKLFRNLEMKKLRRRWKIEEAWSFYGINRQERVRHS